MKPDQNVTLRPLARLVVRRRLRGTPAGEGCCCSALGCGIALGGCGGGGLDGSASDAEQAKVERYLRNVKDVACTHPKGVTRCEVQVRRSPVGVEAWHCEFSFTSDSESAAHSGADSCWTETGSPDNLRPRPRPQAGPVRA